MTNVEIIQAIREEIERRIDALHTHGHFCAEHEFRDVLFFISTLESEKPMNPDDAMKALDEKIALVKQSGTWDGVDVDKYMDEVRGREPEKPMDGLEDELKDYLRRYYNCDYPMQIEENTCSPTMPHIVEAARHFAKWGEHNAMKNLRAARRTEEAYQEVAKEMRKQIKDGEELEEEMDKFFETMPVLEHENIFEETFKNIARHFAEWGAEHLKK